MPHPPVKNAMTPAGTDPFPQYYLVGDRNLPGEGNDPSFHAWNGMSSLFTSPWAQKLYQDYGIHPGRYSDYYAPGFDLSGAPADSSTFDELTQAVGEWLERQIQAGNFPDLDDMIYCLFPSTDHAGPAYGNVWDGFHGAGSRHPFIWVPYDTDLTNTEAVFVDVLSHEIAEAETDLWPGYGTVLSNGQEIADPCQDALFDLPSWYGWTYTAQGFIAANGQCWVPQQPLQAKTAQPAHQLFQIRVPKPPDTNSGTPVNA